jgi:hypothetical protein
MGSTVIRTFHSVIRRKGISGKLGHRWKNTKIDREKKVREGVDWINLA